MQTTELMSMCVCKCMVRVEWTMKWKHPITISLHLSIRTSSMRRAHSRVVSSLFTITYQGADKEGAEGATSVWSTVLKSLGIYCITCCIVICNLWIWYFLTLRVHINSHEAWTCFLRLFSRPNWQKSTLCHGPLHPIQLYRVCWCQAKMG